VRLAAFVSIADFAGHRLRIRLDFGDANRLGAAGNASHEGEVAAIAPHHFDDEGTVMTGGRHFEPVDGFQAHVQGRVHADGHIRPIEVVVDGRCHAHHGKAHIGE